MAMDPTRELPLRVGDVVALRPDVPSAGYPWLQPGLKGRVLFAEVADERDGTGEVTVAFAGHRAHPIRLHRRWLRLMSLPPGGSPWQRQ
jgi:hypothetical protein